MQEHAQNHSTRYTLHLPDRVGPRTESARFRATKQLLCEELDLPCWICRKRRADGAQTEAHHFFVMWAAHEAVDWDEFGRFADTLFNPQTGEHLDPAFDWAAVAADPMVFVDSPQNMVVLCNTHHRSRSEGIHHVPFPEWILQRFPKKGFDFLTSPTSPSRPGLTSGAEPAE